MISRNECWNRVSCRIIRLVMKERLGAKYGRWSGHEAARGEVAVMPQTGPKARLKAQAESKKSDRIDRR